MSRVDVWLRRTHTLASLGVVVGSLVILYTMAASAPGMLVIDVGYGLFILSALTMAGVGLGRLGRREYKTRPSE